MDLLRVETLAGALHAAHGVNARLDVGVDAKLAGGQLVLAAVVLDSEAQAVRGDCVLDHLAERESERTAGACHVDLLLQ